MSLLGLLLGLLASGALALVVLMVWSLFDRRGAREATLDSGGETVN